MNEDPYDDPAYDEANEIREELDNESTQNIVPDPEPSFPPKPDDVIPNEENLTKVMLYIIIGCAFIMIFISITSCYYCAKRRHNEYV